MKVDELYSVDDVVASCKACGAYTLSRDPRRIKHYPGCGGLAEVKKWGKYYSSPGWLDAVTDTSGQYENVGTDGEDHVIGNCKICGAHGVIVGEHVCTGEVNGYVSTSA